MYATKTSRQNQLQKLVEGIGKHFQNVKKLTLGGASYAPTDIQKLIQQALNETAASAQAKAAYLAQVTVERNAHAKASPVLRLFKAQVIAQFGDSQAASSTLEDFGYSPRKSSKKTLAVKVEAAAKTKATREARHTLGTKQKAKIKGGAQPAQPATSPKPTA